MITAHHGDSREVLKAMEAESIDSCVTDPPYALVSIVERFGKAEAAPVVSGGAYARASAGFMGKAWDTGETAFDPTFWREVYRVLKPGAHLVAFGGSRSYGRLQVAIEEAGFEVRDSILDLIDPDHHVRQFCASLNEEQVRQFIRCIEDSAFGGLLAWVYATGFPKSHDVAKAIDKRLGRIGAKGEGASGKGSTTVNAFGDGLNVGYQPRPDYQPVTEEAMAWEGWGTALKPAFEPIILARKPLIGTVAENVLQHGTGALNIDACRVGQRERPKVTDPKRTSSTYGAIDSPGGKLLPDARWPANVVHDGSPAVVDGFPETGGTVASAPTGSRPGGFGNVGADKGTPGRNAASYDDPGGSASRFFFSAKADAEDRTGTTHPTVKRFDLMSWLVKLATPPGGIVLDPFAGSGTTGIAAHGSGFDAVLIEREEEYFADIQRRIAWITGEGRLSALEQAKGLRTEEGRLRAAGLDTPLFGGDV